MSECPYDAQASRTYIQSVHAVPLRMRFVFTCWPLRPLNNGSVTWDSALTQRFWLQLGSDCIQPRTSCCLLLFHSLVIRSLELTSGEFPLKRFKIFFFIFLPLSVPKSFLEFQGGYWMQDRTSIYEKFVPINKLTLTPSNKMSSAVKCKPVRVHVVLRVCAYVFVAKSSKVHYSSSPADVVRYVTDLDRGYYTSWTIVQWVIAVIDTTQPNAWCPWSCMLS